MTKRTYWAEHAWLDDTVEPGVALDVADGRITAVHKETPAPPPGAEVLRGLTLPAWPTPTAMLSPGAARHRPDRSGTSGPGATSCTASPTG